MCNKIRIILKANVCKNVQRNIKTSYVFLIRACLMGVTLTFGISTFGMHKFIMTELCFTFTLI